MRRMKVDIIGFFLYKFFFVSLNNKGKVNIVFILNIENLNLNY